MLPEPVQRMVIVTPEPRRASNGAKLRGPELTPTASVPPRVLTTAKERMGAQLLAPVLVVVPAKKFCGHCTHAAALAAPSLGLYKLGPQGVQVVLDPAPVSELHVPAGQAEQVDSATAPKAELQRPAAQGAHVVTAEAPTASLQFNRNGKDKHNQLSSAQVTTCGQCLQPRAARTDLYLPAAHGVQ